MPNPIEQTILEDIKQRLGYITAANGYWNNVGSGRVHMKQVEVTSSVAPCVMVVPQLTEELEAGESSEACFGETAIRTSLMIGYVVKGQDDDPTKKVSRMISDIIRALPHEPTVTVTKVGDTTTTGMYRLLRKGRARNVTEAVPGVYHGQVNYVIEYSHTVEDDRYVL